MVLLAIKYEANSIKECKNNQQLIKYYHASLVSHPKRTLIEAEAGYLKGCPGLTSEYVASDQTGKFPITSNRGMQYICVFYIYDPNYIKGVALKIRIKEELLRAYQ